MLDALLTVAADDTEAAALAMAVAAFLVSVTLAFVGALVAAAAMLLPFLLPMYFLPALIALFRRKRSRLAIFLVNFFLGWTVVGWIVALVWAARADSDRAPEAPRT